MINLTMLRECTFLLPGYGLDDFPKSLPSDQADNLLSGWIALWHPAMLAKTRISPRWQRADQPPQELAGHLIMVPSISRDLLPNDFRKNVADGGGLVIDAQAGWRTMQTKILELCQAPDVASHIDGWCEDFAALGYAYLQIQLLTRQLRYSSNLDQFLFDDQLAQAAGALLEEDLEKAERMLQSCFDQLGQERDHYYSSEVNLIDTTLLASTTLGSALTMQLERTVPTTVVASANLLQQMANEQSQNFSTIRNASAEKRIAIAGGLLNERAHGLMAMETLMRDLARGKAAYQALGLAPPLVFTRFSYGITPEMALHLKRSGFSAALVVAWSNGTYPQGSQAKISWEASDGTFVSALTPKSVDAADISTYLSLGWIVGEALDHQNVPTLILAHWPDRYSCYFDLLDRIARRTPALGRWINVNEYFEKTDSPYHQERLPANQFQVDWLNDLPSKSSARDLIEAVVAYHRLHVQCRSLVNLANLCRQIEMLVHANGASIIPDGQVEPLQTPDTACPLADWYSELHQLFEQVDSLLDSPSTLSQVLTSIEENCSDIGQQLMSKLACAIGYQPSAATRQPSHHTLVFNPHSNPLRTPFRTEKDSMPITDARWCYATGRVGDHRTSMIDVPPFGVLCAKFEPRTENANRKEKPLAQVNGLLYNDFLEAQIDPKCGHLRSLHVPGKRGNRLSIQIARRETHGGTSGAQYSEVRHSETKMLGSSNLFGLIRATGELWFDSQKTAKFEIDYQVLRGSRVLAMTIRLDALAKLGADPWKSAYVLRTAWPNESAIITSFVGGEKQTWSRGQTVSPLLVEIDEADYRTQLFTGGLAFHRRVDMRFMETLLAVSGTTEIQRRLGVGVELPYPLHAAEQFLDRQYAIDVEPPSRKMSESQWFMHVDAKYVRMQLASPLVDSNRRDIGLRIHLTETQGKSANTIVRLPREVSTAHRVDYLGQELGKVTAESDSITIVLRPHEMTFVDVYWK